MSRLTAISLRSAAKRCPLACEGPRSPFDDRQQRAGVRPVGINPQTSLFETALNNADSAMPRSCWRALDFRDVAAMPDGRSPVDQHLPDLDEPRIHRRFYEHIINHEVPHHVVHDLSCGALIAWSSRLSSSVRTSDGDRWPRTRPSQPPNSYRHSKGARIAAFRGRRKPASNRSTPPRR